MKLSRRAVLQAAPLGAAPLLAGALAPAASAQTPAPATDLKTRLGLIGPGDDPVFSKRPGAVGAASSRHDEISKAFRLMWDAPHDTDHMKVARYFQNIQDKNADNEVYNQEWAKRANPLITALFGMTATSPMDGDQTSWCAAFVSFVLYAAKKPTQFCAQSGSYRTYGQATTKPKVGDIVVFQNTDASAAQGFGHVGFFISQTETNVTVLGGNQGKSGKGQVNETTFAKAGAKLQLHSYRTVA